jgi:4-hydroxybenzoate polyprenyltransferase
MVKFEHSVFALPFALASLFLATSGNPALREILWVTVAMVGARSLAMTLNRILDHRLDALNPRTRARALPAGDLTRGEAWLFALLSWGVLMAAVLQLHPVCRYLWPPVVALFFFYPYTKRFTWLSHFVLGICLGLAPVGAWIAVSGGVTVPVLLLGLAVTLWTAGFDIIYACQDIENDIRHGLFSIPARFGPDAALSLSRTLHLASFLLLVTAGALFHLTLLYYVGLTIVALLLLYEHRLVRPGNYSRLDLAFFAMNGVIAAVFFFFTAVDLTLARIL